MKPQDSSFQNFGTNICNQITTDVGVELMIIYNSTPGLSVAGSSVAEPSMDAIGYAQ